jgi:hypothetical protein
MKQKALGLIAIAVLSVSIAGCSSAPTTSPTTPSSPATTTAARPPIVSGIPKPSAAQEVRLLAELGKVHPALNHDRSVHRSRNVCGDILNKEKEAAILDRARKRFEGGSTGPLTQEHAKKIVAVIKANGFCVKS